MPDSNLDIRHAGKNEFNIVLLIMLDSGTTCKYVQVEQPWLHGAPVEIMGIQGGLVIAVQHFYTMLQSLLRPELKTTLLKASVTQTWGHFYPLQCSAVPICGGTRCRLRPFINNCLI